MCTKQNPDWQKRYNKARNDKTLNEKKLQTAKTLMYKLGKTLQKQLNTAKKMETEKKTIPAPFLLKLNNIKHFIIFLGS